MMGMYDRPASETAGFRDFASVLFGPYLFSAGLCSCSRIFGKSDRQTIELVGREVYVSVISLFVFLPPKLHGIATCRSAGAG